MYRQVFPPSLPQGSREEAQALHNATPAAEPTETPCIRDFAGRDLTARGAPAFRATRVCGPIRGCSCARRRGDPERRRYLIWAIRFARVVCRARTSTDRSMRWPATVLSSV